MRPRRRSTRHPVVLGGFEVGCDNGERVSVAFTLDCCDREAAPPAASIAGTSATR
jgi:hypothetical protein